MGIASIKSGGVEFQAPHLVCVDIRGTLLGTAGQ